MHRNVTNLVFIIGLLIAITACVCRSDRDQEPGTSSNASPTSDPGKRGAKDPDSGSKSSGKDTGSFKVEHIDVTSQEYNEIDRQVRNDKLMEKAADQLNRSLKLPNDITLRTKECGKVNAFWDPSDHSVTVCYELMKHFFGVFRSAGLTGDKAYEKMFDAVRFVFLHEIGHALIDTYKLPVTGNEEDAADRCSAYINLSELGEDGVNAVFAAAEAFQIESKSGSATDKRNLADEHLLQEQRFYNSLCMIYGSNSSKYENIVTKGFLPKERAVRCEAEYQRTSESWKNLIAPYRK
jgi:hypothetical protein